MRSLLVAVVALGLAVPAAEAGKSIKPRPQCPDPFAAADVDREREDDRPGIELRLESTAPYAFDDVFSAPI